MIVVCHECKKEFERVEKRKLKRNKRHFCSVKCRNNNYKKNNKNVLVKCANCEKEFKKRERFIKRTKNNFCSHTCSAIYNNKQRLKISRKKNCLFCNKEFYYDKNKDQKYCNNICQQKYEHIEYIKRWKDGK